MNAFSPKTPPDTVEQSAATQPEIVPLSDFELDHVGGGDGKPDWG